MSKQTLQLKSPGTAALLAFLIPGLGHLYQGRIFKAIVYFVCIMGTFVVGMRIGDCKVVYFDWNKDQKTFPYLCQFFVGLPALPALFQVYLRSPADFEPNYLPKPITSPFTGTVTVKGEPPMPFTGTVTLESSEALASQLQGKVSGTLTTSKGEVRCEGTIQELELAQRVSPDAERHFNGNFNGKSLDKDGQAISGEFHGGIPRSWPQRYGAPLLDRAPSPRRGALTDLESAHGKLGRNFELGVLYTMVAGLLNILAIYDALEGPAYGEDEENQLDPARPNPVPTPT